MIARSRFFFDLDFLPMRLRILPEFGRLLQNVESVAVKLRDQSQGLFCLHHRKEGGRVVATDLSLRLWVIYCLSQTIILLTF
jgi:hypothetical protein